MIEPTGYRASCDFRFPYTDARCSSSFEATSIFGRTGIYQRMEREGWQRNVKLNGDHARRGGKDYCPKHRRGEPK